MRRRLVIVGLIALLGLSLAIGGCQTAETTATEPSASEPSSEQPAVQAAQEPDVPVFIEAFYPLNEGHMFIAEYLREFEDRYPGEVKVVIHDMQTEEGRQAWAKTGLNCAGVFVNGSTRHTIERDGESETVDFLQRLDVFWTREDFETVVGQLLAEAGEGDVSGEQSTEKTESGG
jgi:ABC-type glycerol-3-phosphate transport system substrate-binding protein